MFLQKYVLLGHQRSHVWVAKMDEVGQIWYFLFLN